MAVQTTLPKQLKGPAAELAEEEMTASEGGEVEKLQSKVATHMLLYLSKETFVGSAGDRLAEEVRRARATKLPVLLLHEKNSCEFGLFFQTTPQDLIADGVYKMVALELLPAPHDAVSAVHLARALGATPAKRLEQARHASRATLAAAPWATRRFRSSQVVPHPDGEGGLEINELE